MFQCDWCNKYIEDGCTIYVVTEGEVIEGEDDNLEMNDEKFIYCSPLCLETDYDP